MADPTRLRSFAWVALAYLISAGVAVAASRAGSGWPAWVTLLVADLAATAVVFAFSVALDNSSTYDPYWSVAPMVIAPWLAVLAPSPVPLARRIIVVALVLVWGARLTTNWARGWRGLAHEDWRYVDLRGKTGRAYWLVSLLGLHVMPTLWVYLGSLSLLPALATGTAALGWLDGVAFAITAGAIALETIADEQLRAFRRTGSGEILARGVWRFSRHPNYVGEIGFWWGLYLFAVAADPAAWLAIVGPLAITGLFVFISVPLLDRRSLVRRPGYADHMARVPALVPRLTRAFAAGPRSRRR